MRHLELRPVPARRAGRAVRGAPDPQRAPRDRRRGEPPPRRDRQQRGARVPARHLPRQIARGNRRVDRPTGDRLTRPGGRPRPAIATGAVMTDHHGVSVIGPGAGQGTLTGQPERVAETDAHEGPVYIPGQDALYFTTLPRTGNIPAPGTPQVVIKRLTLNGLSFPVDESRLSALPADVHMPNGMTLGHDGRLVVCEQGTRSEHARISRVDPVTGQVEGLVGGWGGLRLNSPNDVVVRGDG